jgi:hypothetical protein
VQQIAGLRRIAEGLLSRDPSNRMFHLEKTAFMRSSVTLSR